MIVGHRKNASGRGEFQFFQKRTQERRLNPKIDPREDPFIFLPGTHRSFTIGDEKVRPRQDFPQPPGHPGNQACPRGHDVPAEDHAKHPSLFLALDGERGRFEKQRNPPFRRGPKKGKKRRKVICPGKRLAHDISNP
jgi:hypothetical protein